MSTTTGSFTFFNSFKKASMDGTIDLDSHEFKLMLCSATQALSAAGQSVYADITAQLPTANGYTAGGQALTNVTWGQTAGVGKFDSDDPSWTANGGDITAFYWVLYDATPASKPLVAFGLLDTTAGGTAVTVTAGNPLTHVVPANGWFNLT